MVADQEALLNVYRCRFDIDTALVPGGCQNDESTPEPEVPVQPTPATPETFDPVPPDNDDFTQADWEDDARDRPLLPPVIMPRLTIKLTSSPNCSVYVHTLDWRNTLDYAATLDDYMNNDYANPFPPIRLGIYIRNTDSDDLTPVTQIPIEGKAKQLLPWPSNHGAGEFVQAIYDNANSANQRHSSTKHNYLFSLINADDDLWDDIENNNREFIFKVLGHYRKDNTFVDWGEQAKSHPDDDFKQYYQDLIDHQDHTDDDNAEKLKIFYDPNDPLDHLDFYNLKRQDCSKDAEATSVLPDNWLELTPTEKVELNPYGCSDVAIIQDNGRCATDILMNDKTSTETSTVQLKISIEEVIAKDKMSAEYRIKLDSPEKLDLNEVKIQYKVIHRHSQCSREAPWNELFISHLSSRGREAPWDELFMSYHNTDILFDRWRDKPNYFSLKEGIVANVYGGSILCVKASKLPDNKHTYIDAYEGVRVDKWRLHCYYMLGIWKICV